VVSDVDGRIALFLPSMQQAAVLNETASDVWRLCDGDHDLDEIIELLATAYATTPAAIGDDVAATVERFEREGFLPLEGDE
jgi:hypothetical protein